MESVDLPCGRALIVGDALLDTAFWQANDSSLIMVRIWFSETDFDVDDTMRSLPQKIFNNSAEELDFCFNSSDLVMFDAAYAGLDNSKETLGASIKPGQYRILTQPFDPNPSASLVLHRFDLLSPW